MKSKEFIVILVITLIVGVIWGVSDLIHTKSNANNLPDVAKYLEPINPDFDHQTLERIGSLSAPAPASSSLPQASASPAPSAVVSPTPTASASATPRTSANPSPN